MNTIILIVCILVAVAVIWHKSIGRSWRMVTFGMNILTNDNSRLVGLLTPTLDLVKTEYEDLGGKLPLHIFQPRKVNHALPAVILYHGASPKGLDHPAMILLAKNLALLGMRVYFPSLPKLNDMLLSEDTYPRMLRIFKQISTRDEVINDKILITGVSFSGGIVSKLSTEPDINPAGVISFGSYYNLAETMRFFFTGHDESENEEVKITPHEYTKAVWFWNYLDHIDLKSVDTEKIRSCIGHFIRDDKVKSEEVFLSCGKEERDFLKLVFDPGNPASQRYLDEAEVKVLPEVNNISPHLIIDKIKAPMFIIHGVQDNMIPYTQALKFSEALKKAGKEHYLYLMRIYAHSETGKSSLTEFLVEVKAIYRLLSSLLKAIE